MALNKRKPQQANKQPKVKTKKTKKQIVNMICIGILSVLLIGSVSAFVIVQTVMAEKGRTGELSSKDSTQIMDKDGKLITTLSTLSGVRENIKYEQLPQVVIDAFIATEDSRFFKHNGFDFPRFLKSGYENILAGGISQGGSTLTMQLVDVQLFSEEEKASFGFKDKIEQKIVEIFQSMEIESNATKEKILEDYLNGVNFGGPARGIQKGSQYYFGKDAKDLTLSEAAFLAGVINAPGSYNPYYGTETFENGAITDHYALAMKRRNLVLELMNNHGYIDNDEYHLAVSTELSFQLNGEKNFETEKYKAYVDTVVAEAKEKTGLDPYTTPMMIYTSMDRDAQDLSDNMCDGIGINFPDELFQTGFVATNNQTGEIAAIGGGRSYTGGTTQKNRGMVDTHQIGSTSKPIVDYAPAFEYLGYSTEHVFEDGPTPYGEGGEVLQNYSRTFSGDVTFKEAVGKSLNVPAYKALRDVIDKIGVKKEIELLQSMGLDVSEDEFSYAMSIGGGNMDASPVQLAGAFSVFANEGNFVEPHTITKIEFKDSDKEPYETEIEKQRVFSEETAFLMSHILKDAVDNTSYGTLVNTLRSSYPVYGKSGTSDFDSETAAHYGFPDGVARDKWMVGYTSKYTVACWAGYDEPIAGKNTYLDQNKIFANIEGKVVKGLLDTLSSKEESVPAIAQPDGVVSITHIQGLFPYATASNNDGALMVTGLINKKFAGTLKSVAPDGLSELASLNASANGNSVTIAFAPYPDSEKLSIASGTKTMTSGKTTATGKRIFDKSFLFGAVQYKYQVLVNGVVVDSGASSDSTIKVSVNAKPGDTVTVKGWYGYSNASVTSSTLTSTVKFETVTYPVGGEFKSAFGAGSYDKTISRLENLLGVKYKGVGFEYVADEDVASGEYSSKNDRYTSFVSGNTYTIYIGSK